jgi:hypothetical protein
MACGNNMVLRSSLQALPTAMSHPTSAAADALPRQRVVEAARQADRQVAQAQQAVRRASTEPAVRSALQDAEKALDAARRGSRSARARSALRTLERRVEQLRREAMAKQKNIAQQEDHEREQHASWATAPHIDRLSPLQLGVVPQVVHTEAGQEGARNHVFHPAVLETRLPEANVDNQRAAPSEPVRELSNNAVAAALNDAASVVARSVALSAGELTVDQLSQLARTAQSAVDKARIAGAEPQQLAPLKAKVSQLHSQLSRRRNNERRGKETSGSDRPDEGESLPSRDQSVDAVAAAVEHAASVLARNLAASARSPTLDQLSQLARTAQSAVDKARTAGAEPQQLAPLKAKAAQLQRQLSIQRNNDRNNGIGVEAALGESDSSGSPPNQAQDGPLPAATVRGWEDAYLRRTAGNREIVHVSLDGFTYSYDSTLSEEGAANRLVAVWGRSGPALWPRDENRMRRFPSPAGKSEEPMDRGHGAARSIGGREDINLIPQLRSLNQGREWRALERYLEKHLGTPFFVRPIYADTSDFPVAIEYGIMKHDGTWRVVRFSNR